MFVCVVPSSQPSSRDLDYPLWDVSYLRKNACPPPSQKKPCLPASRAEQPTFLSAIPACLAILHSCLLVCQLYLPVCLAVHRAIVLTCLLSCLPDHTEWHSQTKCNYLSSSIYHNSVLLKYSDNSICVREADVDIRWQHVKMLLELSASIGNCYCKILSVFLWGHTS